MQLGVDSCSPSSEVPRWAGERFCSHCGSFVSQQTGKLAAVCQPPSATGREYSRRINSGLWPKVLSRAEQARINKHLQ
eukprot:9503152-Pyramimonas_sp.AAC.1